MGTAERIAPEDLLDQTNLVGSVGAIQDDPDSPDSDWLTASSNHADSICRVSFPTPSGDPTVGANIQSFRALVRKMGGTGTPQCRIELWEDGSVIRAGSDVNVTNTSGVVLSLDWNANELSLADGSEVECLVFGTRSGGGPSVRAAIEVGAVSWSAELEEASIPETDGALNEQLDELYASAEGLVENNAALDESLDSLSLSAEGTVESDLDDIIGSLVESLDDLALQAEAELDIFGELAEALDDLALQAEAEADVFGELAESLDDLALQAEAEADVFGELAESLDDLALQATGVLGSGVSGHFNQTLGDLQVSSTGELEINGILLDDFEDVQLTATGSLDGGITGQLNATMDSLTIESMGCVEVLGTFNETLEDLKYTSGSGQVEISGQLDETLDTLGVSAAGFIDLQEEPTEEPVFNTVNYAPFRALAQRLIAKFGRSVTLVKLANPTDSSNPHRGPAVDGSVELEVKMAFVELDTFQMNGTEPGKNLKTALVAATEVEDLKSYTLAHDGGDIFSIESVKPFQPGPENIFYFVRLEGIG